MVNIIFQMDKSGKKPSEVKNSKKSRYAKHANSNTNTSSYVDKITDDRLDAYGLNPKKVRNKFKFGKK